MRRNLVAATIAVPSALGLIAWVVGSRSAPSKPTPDATSDKVVAAKTSKTGRKPAGGAIAVKAATVRGATTTTEMRAIGSLQSNASVQITSEIAGRTAEISFNEGGTVNAGEVLVKLDDALAQVEVTDAQAGYNLAAANSQRAKQLSRTGNATERATANFEPARAALELQPVRLAKHTIKTPFPGRVGVRKVSPGGGSAVGEIHAIDPLVDVNRRQIR